MVRPLLLLPLLACLTGANAAFVTAQAASPAPADAAAPAPATPRSEVEQRWGIRILGVRLSAAGYMMDFRYYVADVVKAAPLFTRGLQPVVEHEKTGSKFIVPAPPKTGPLRSTNTPQAGRTYFMFFANPARFVKPGDAVAVSIGDFRVEHLPVMAESEPFPEMPRFDSKSVTVRHAEAPATGAPSGAPEHGTTAAVTMGRARPTAVTVPDLDLTNQDGVQMNLHDLVGEEAPVILTFMYTSCATNCPVMASTLSQVQRDLGQEAERVRIVSISIDPEHDSPARMREFLAKQDARPGWVFLTGTRGQSEAIQRAFDVYRGNKETHPPAFFVHDARSGDWWRIGGLPPASVVTSEYRRLAAAGR